MNPFTRPVDILDVTLRDGSYLIDFQFTAEDTALIASTLEALGFDWVEVGHGLGMNASRAGKGKAAEPDERYLEAAAGALSRARWGVFFIPGIGRMEDLDLLARMGASFVRVGTNVTEVEQGRPFIEKARELGLLVSYNAMKSYAVSADEFGRCAARTADWGASIVCLVDSAGGILPDDVADYLAAARRYSQVPLGFHGHDNLSMGMANTLRAIDCGAVLVDSSLRGMGRSAGNARTEVLVALLKRRGLAGHIDLNGTIDAGLNLIAPLVERQGSDPLAVTAGYSLFHSSFTPQVSRYADQHGVDVRDLIERLCREDLVGAPEPLLDRLGQELAETRTPRVFSIPVFPTRGPEALQGEAALEELLRRLRPMAVKHGKRSALNVVFDDRPLEGYRVSGNVHGTPGYVLGSVSLSSEEALRDVLGRVDGAVDLVFLDVDRKPHGPLAPDRVAAGCLKESLLLTYLDSRVWVDAVESQVARLLGEVGEGVPVVVAGGHPRTRLLASRLRDRGCRVTLAAEEPQAGEVARSALGTALGEARVVVAWPVDAPWFGLEQCAHLKEGQHLVDAGIGGILPEGLEEARRRGVSLLRVNIWPSLAAALEAAQEADRVFRGALGRAEVAGVPVVAGGALGLPGDVVVDSARRPARVIGVADGRGGIRFHFEAGDLERVQRVKDEIHRQVLAPRVKA